MWTDGVDVLPHELTTMEHAATVAAMAIAQERSMRLERAAPPHAAAHAARLRAARSTAPRSRAGRRRWAGTWTARAPSCSSSCATARATASRSPGRPGSRTGSSARRRTRCVPADRLGAALGARAARRAAAVARVGSRATCTPRCARAGGGRRRMVAAGEVARRTSTPSAAATRRPPRRSRSGRELSGRDFVLEHEELGVYRLLSRLPLDELRRQRAEAIGPLLEYDRDHNGALVHTLEVFLALRAQPRRGGRGAVHPLQHAALPARRRSTSSPAALSGDSTAPPQPRAGAVRPPPRARARGGVTHTVA